MNDLDIGIFIGGMAFTLVIGFYGGFLFGMFSKIRIEEQP